MLYNKVGPTVVNLNYCQYIKSSLSITSTVRKFYFVQVIISFSLWGKLLQEICDF